MLSALILFSCSNERKEESENPSLSQPSAFNDSSSNFNNGNSFHDSIFPISDGEAQNEHPVSEKEKNYHAKRGVSTLEDAYLEGYNDGYEDGEEDASEGSAYGISFDPDSDFSGKYASSYESGYQDGYHDGYHSNYVEDDEDE